MEFVPFTSNIQVELLITKGELLNKEGRENREVGDKEDIPSILVCGYWVLVILGENINRVLEMVIFHDFIFAREK